MLGEWRRLLPMRGLTDDGLLLERRHPMTIPGAVDFGHQRLYRFANGYGASVCDGEIITAGAPFELGVLVWTGLGDEDCAITHATPFGPTARSDADGVNSMLGKIKALPIASVDAAPQLWN